MVEPSWMLYSRQSEDLLDGGSEVFLDEHMIFSEVFFGSDNSIRQKGYILSDTTTMDGDYIKQNSISVCSKSGSSSLTSQDDHKKEDLSGNNLSGDLPADPTFSVKGSHGMQLPLGDLPIVKSDLCEVSIAYAQSEGIISGTSQENSGSACQTSPCYVVESSSYGVTSSTCEMMSLAYVDKGCEIGGVGCSKERVSSLDNNNQKIDPNTAVTSPVSQESCASKEPVTDLTIFVPSKLAIHRPTKPKWKDSCFVKLDDEELAMPKDIKNDPRPILRYHIHRLFGAAGWVIGRRKRNSKYNGIGEYVYKSPEGRPIREFHRAWCMCGESLFSSTGSFMLPNEMQWVDMTELWDDLSTTIKEIDEKLNVLETASSMVHLWCLLDPFANVVFIEKSIRLLKEGNTIKAKKSLAIPSDLGTVPNYRKISKSEKSTLDSRHLQNWGYDDLDQDMNLYEVPITSELPQVVGETQLMLPLRDSNPTSSHDNQARDEEEAGAYTRRTHKKSRKISEIGPVEGKDYFGVGDISTATCGSKKSKAYCLHDDDLLISSVIKTNSGKATNKWSNRKSKSTKKRKTPKGSCRLLPKKGAKLQGNWCAVGSRTVLSWLLHSGVISVNDVIQYRILDDVTVVKEGIITAGGILCKCCNAIFSLSNFKSHASLRANRPCTNLFMESGKPFTFCQLEAWSGEYKAKKAIPKIDEANAGDQNDDSCGRCGDVGELICCDNCPSAFHQACLFEQELPEGNWYCPQCRCQICGDAVNDKESQQLHQALKCSQCEDRYHGTCTQQSGEKFWSATDTWFCKDSCHKVYIGLQSRLGIQSFLDDGFSWTLLRCIPGYQMVNSMHVALKAECNSKLAVAITIMEECFLPMVDMKTGIDMIPQVMYNWGSQFSRLNYSGFYTAVLEKNDVILSVASIRIHGVKVAELPLIATCSKYRRQGMCRRLINSVEEMLKSLNVEMLVISAIPTLVETWIVGFGFQTIEEDERRTLSKTNLMVFPGSVWLKKMLSESHTTEYKTIENNQIPGKDLSIPEERLWLTQNQPCTI